MRDNSSTEGENCNKQQLKMAGVSVDGELSYGLFNEGSTRTRYHLFTVRSSIRKTILPIKIVMASGGCRVLDF